MLPLFGFPTEDSVDVRVDRLNCAIRAINDHLDDTDRKLKALARHAGGRLVHVEAHWEFQKDDKEEGK